MSKTSAVDSLLVMLDQAYDRKSWHGTNLRGSIRRVPLPVAAWRPAPGRHNIWEIVVHAATGVRAAWRRLAGAARGSFPLEGSNWFERPGESSEAAWRRDVSLLGQTHVRAARGRCGDWRARSPADAEAGPRPCWTWWPASPPTTCITRGKSSC